MEELMKTPDHFINKLFTDVKDTLLPKISNETDKHSLHGLEITHRPIYTEERHEYNLSFSKNEDNDFMFMNTVP